MKKDKDTKERKKRRKIFKSKKIDPNIEKVEFQDKLNNLSHGFIIVGRVKKEFTNSQGHMKLWVDMSPVHAAGPKVIRSEVKGHIIQIYQERVAFELIRLMQNGAFRHTLTGYLDNVVAMPLRDKKIRIVVKRA